MQSTASLARRSPRMPRSLGSVAPPARRFTLAEYHGMGEAGILTENDRCELIRGIIREKPVINPSHKKAVRRLLARLVPILGGDFVVDSQAPISLLDSEPEPDISVAEGPESKYDNRHAGPSEVVLVVEVSDSTLDYDRGEKLELYASNLIPQYWIVNIPDRRIEVYTQPRAGRKPTYRKQASFRPGDSVPVAIGGKKLGEIPVSELLP